MGCGGRDRREVGVCLGCVWLRGGGRGGVAGRPGLMTSDSSPAVHPPAVALVLTLTSLLYIKPIDIINTRVSPML